MPDKLPECVGPPTGSSGAVTTSGIIRGGAIFLACRLSSQIFQWGVTLYVARLLVPADYGLMTMLTVIVGCADLLAEAGLGRALIHKQDLQPNDAAEAFTINIALTAVLYALMWMAAPTFAAYLEQPEFTTLLRVTALVLWLVPLQSICGAIIERSFLLTEQSIIVVLVAFAQGTLVLGLAYAGYGVWALVSGIICARVCQCLLTWRASRWQPALAWPSPASLPMLRYGVAMSLSTLMWFIHSNADFAVIAALLGATALGYYALAFQLISLPVDKLAATVNQVAFPVYCRLQADRAGLNRVFVRVIALMALVSTPVLIGLALIAEDAIPLLLGAKWQPAVMPLQMLAPVGVLMVTASAFPPLLNALGRPDITLRYAILRAVVFPLAFVLMARTDGIFGVCLVWLLLLPVFLVGLIHWTRSTTGIGYIEVARPLFPVFTGAVCMSAAVYAVRSLMPGDDSIGLRLSVAIVTGAAAYCGWIFATARHTLLADVAVMIGELRGQSSDAR